MATEKRLIDANALVKQLKKSHEYHARNCREEVLLYRDIRIINEQPTVDAVEVVRCKNCASGKGSTHKVCPLYKQGLMRDDDFCSYGERVTEEEC